MSQVRLLPLVAAAAGALLLLKIGTLIFNGTGMPGMPRAFAQDDGARLAVEASGDVASRSRDGILESLSDRRAELDEREREIDLRERLLEATRVRVEDRISELRELEARIAAAVDAQDQQHKERFSGLVTMYESMKPRDAANIFNRLEMPILARVAGEMNARRMAEILAAMDPDMAQRLTIELSAAPRDPLEFDEAEELPKIMGTMQGG